MTHGDERALGVVKEKLAQGRYVSLLRQFDVLAGIGE
jgi:hypothetical protein